MLAKRAAYTLAPKARQDLEVIWRYTMERWSVAQADLYYGDLTTCFSDLANGSRHGRNIDRIKPGYRAVACGSHFIIYRETSNSVRIIRILHRRMNIAVHL